MNKIKQYISMPLSFFEMVDILSQLPSPRKKFFELIVNSTGLSPNTVTMVLSSTDNGFTPSEETRCKIAELLGCDVDELFPEQRNARGSLIHKYQALSSHKVEYQKFIRYIASVAEVSPATVKTWISKRRVPRLVVQRRIAKAMDRSIEKLFNS